MTFIVASLNHFRAVQNWARATGAEVNLDVCSFELEVKARHRYYRLMPQFLATMGHRYGHVTSLTPDAMGLAGWLPYRVPLQWALSTDKLVFKAFVSAGGFLTPAHWTSADSPTVDYILKSSQGSFGYGLLGPYPAGATRPEALQPATGQFFAEEFIQGRALKAWFWGQQPFYVHLQDRPTVVADGRTSLQALVERRLAQVGRGWDDTEDIAVLRMALQYQNLALGDVLPDGAQVWLDYRYGRSWAPSSITATSDNDLERVPAQAFRDIEALGAAVAAELAREVPAPVLYSLDGVLDADDHIHWLEMNSNPLLPPDGYPLILDTLFC